MQAINFLQQCKRIFANANDLQHLQALAQAQYSAWNAEQHFNAAAGAADSVQTRDISDALLNSYAYFYCYRLDLTVEELCAITSVLQEEFDMEGNLDALHLQTQDELDGWIAQLL
jgi:hypothetical protein